MESGESGKESLKRLDLSFEWKTRGGDRQRSVVSTNTQMIALLSMGVATYRLMPNDQHFATFFPLHLNVAMDLSPLGIESVCIPAARPNDFRGRKMNN